MNASTQWDSEDRLQEIVPITTDTQLPRSFSPATSVRRAALLALCFLAPAFAFATQPPETRFAKVALEASDLTTAEGSRAAYERIKKVAEQLCFQVETDPFREVYARCVRETLNEAIRQINVPTLVALEK